MSPREINPSDVTVIIPTLNEEGAFTRLNLLGNKLLNWFFRSLYGIELHDILPGYV